MSGCTDMSGCAPCDLSCERRVTWLPEAGRIFKWPKGKTGPGFRFMLTAGMCGGGVLRGRKPGNLWKKVATKQVMRGK